MIYEFTTTLPENNTQPILISDEKSKELHRVEYLLVENNGIKNSYEIRYDYSCSPFREIKITKNILAVGFEGYFYLFDLQKNKNIVSIELEGYFGHLYFHQGLFYVADAYGVKCINQFGEIVWKNSEIAIDGVVIEDFNETKIYGKGEQDPPNGWQDFVLNLVTGEII